MKVLDHDLGTLIETDQFIAFFGNRNAQVENLKKAFPQFQFKRIHQVHGDVLAETTSSSVDFSVKADAHWTKEKNLALCISTADCTPALFYSPKDNLVCGIHAGWRGVENRIIPKSIEALASDSKDLKMLIGPHIQKCSFEIEDSIGDKIISTCSAPKNSLKETSSPGKSLVDLHLVVKTQVTDCGAHNSNIWELMKDTKTDLNYHSYRRDKENSGRQQSFIVLK